MTCKTTHYNACDCREAKIAKLVEALEVVVQRYESVGPNEAHKQGVSLGVYTVCKRALAEFRGEK